MRNRTQEYSLLVAVHIVTKNPKMFAAGICMTIKCLFHRDSRLEIMFNNFLIINIRHVIFENRKNTEWFRKKVITMPIPAYKY